MQHETNQTHNPEPRDLSEIQTRTDLTAAWEEFFYTPIAQDELALFEDKARRGWNRGAEETREEREARLEASRKRTDETHEKVEAGLESLSAALAAGKSEPFRLFLDSLSRFHGYSWGNTLLIALQQPGATLVSGFNTWKTLGRFVKAGEKGIAILAPITKRVRAEDREKPAEGEEEEEGTSDSAAPRRVQGFKVVFVFDVGQTDGALLPEFPTYHGDPAHYLPRLKEQIQAGGIGLMYHDNLGGALGRSHSGRIEILTRQTPAREFGVLVHEFAHELLHPLTERSQIPKTVKETEAEAVAYVVGHAIGLEPGTASSDYIQLYQGDAATLAASLDRIQKTAARILSQLEEGSVISTMESGA